MKRRASPVASIVAIVALVFAQMVAAAYACEIGMGGNAVAAGQTNGDCCDPGNTAPDAGCHNHCQQASKAPERVVALGVAPLTEASVGTPLRIEGHLRPPTAPSLQAPKLARHIEPPIAIRNCCFRI